MGWRFCCCGGDIGPPCPYIDDEFITLDAWTEVSGNWSISTGRAFTTDTDAELIATGLTATSERFEIAVNILSASDDDEARIIFGRTGASDYYYLQIRFHATNSSATAIELYQVSGGTPTLIVGQFSCKVSEPTTVSIAWNSHSLLMVVTNVDFQSTAYTDGTAQLYANVSIPNGGFGIGTGAQSSSSLLFEDFFAQGDCPRMRVCGDGCDGEIPDTVEVEIAGMTDDDAGGCSALNGTFVLTRDLDSRHPNLHLADFERNEGCSYVLNTNEQQTADTCEAEVWMYFWYQAAEAAGTLPRREMLRFVIHWNNRNVGVCGAVANWAFFTPPLEEGTDPCSTGTYTLDATGTAGISYCNVPATVEVTL